MSSNEEGEQPPPQEEQPLLAATQVSPGEVPFVYPSEYQGLESCMFQSLAGVPRSIG
jgi:hypothetical protein